jgi:hypothetical protein
MAQLLQKALPRSGKAFFIVANAAVFPDQHVWHGLTVDDGSDYRTLVQQPLLAMVTMMPRLAFPASRRKNVTLSKVTVTFAVKGQGAWELQSIYVH